MIMVKYLDSGMLNNCDIRLVDIEIENVLIV